MTTNRITSHTDCLHEATKAARATCRRDRNFSAAAEAKAIDDLIAAFSAKALFSSSKLFYAANRFTNTITSDPRIAAAAVLRHFAPSGDEDIDSNRRLNGYTITTSPEAIVSLTLRAAS